MTDNSILIPNQQGLTDSLMYTLKKSAVRSRSYRASISPSNGQTFAPQSMAILYIPGGRRNTYLDGNSSYLRMTVQNNDTNAMALDCTFACMVNRLDIFHGSNLVETIQQYNVLFQYLMDFQLNYAQKVGFSAMYGFHGSAVTTSVPIKNGINCPVTSATISGAIAGATTGTLAAADAQIQVGQLVECPGITTPIYVAAISGTSITFSSAVTVAANTEAFFSYVYQNGLRSGAIIQPTQQLTGCIPLLSGLFGLGSDSYLPIGELNDDIRLELTFEQLNASVCWMTANNNTVSTTAPSTGWKIINLELDLQIVELSDEGQHIVQSISPFDRPVFLHGKSWRHYASTVPSGSSGQQSFLVPARFASTCTLVTLPRRGTEQTAYCAYSLSSRANPNIANYWWRIGAFLIPQKMINLVNANTTGGYAEGFAEVQKSWHAMNHPEYASSIPFSLYNVADAADGTVGGGGVLAINTDVNSNLNAFAIAQELETFAQKSDVILSGMNTLASQIFFEFNIGSTAPSTTYLLDFFAQYDSIFVIEHGLISSRF